MAFINILRAMNNAEVEYVIAGGYACILHGVPRMTFDLDLLLNLQHPNLEKFVRVVDSYRYKPKVPVSIYDLVDEEKIKDWIENKNAKAINLVSPTHPQIDILFDVPVDYITAKQRCEYGSFRGMKLPILCMDDLILCKKSAGRSVDLSDLKVLELIKHRRWKDG